MAKKKGNPKKGRITAKRVQATENDPAPIPVVTVRADPDPDDERWGKDGLNYKQRRFVRAYLGRAAGCATKAAELAGYPSENRNVLTVTAHRVLRKANVQRAIARAIAKREGGPAWTMAGIVELARANMADFVEVDEQGKTAFSLAKAHENGAMGSVKKLRIRDFDGGQEITLETYDRLDALKTLAKVHGKLVERQHHTFGPPPLDDVLRDAESARLVNALARRVGVQPRGDGPSTN